MDHEKRDFLVVLRPSENGSIAVTCPALPGAISRGKDHEEALANIIVAIKLCLESGDVPLEVVIMTVTVTV